VSKLSNLINLASEKNWCTRLYCTTCGALDFRSELRKLSNEEILEDLRDLPETFCEHHADVLRLVFVEIAMFPTCIDLIDALENTPAGAILDSAIRHSKCIEERRREHERWCSPEAAKERAILRMQAKAVSHAKRLESKANFDAMLLRYREAVLRCDYNVLFSDLRGTDDSRVVRAVGGIGYTSIRDALSKGALGEDDLALIEKFSAQYGGYWAKLSSSVGLGKD